MAELALEPIEIACGHALGATPPTERPAARPGSPLEALEAAVEPALRCSPCLVSFSGGVDSTLVLAVATRAARRRGLADPIPISWRFTTAPAAEESRWQELVVAALGIGEWARLTAADELDFVGPVAQRVLTRHGLLHPPNAFLHEPLLRSAANGALLTGIGGDQVLGLWRGRALADVFARRRPPNRSTLLTLARALSPAAVRVLRERRQMPDWTWLSPGARREATRRLADERAAEPIGWAGHLRWQLARRDTALFGQSMNRLAHGVGATNINPLLEPGFVDALALAGGRLGFGDRRATITALFADVMPLAVLERRDKARFDEVFWGEATRALTREWDGEALDERLVDPAALRTLWSTGQPHARTALLAQQVWLAAQPPSPARTTGAQAPGRG